MRWDVEICTTPNALQQYVVEVQKRQGAGIQSITPVVNYGYTLFVVVVVTHDY